jgi:hypothetical protein
MTGYTKREILATPGYPRRLERPSSTAHRISNVPGKGLGIFATRELKMGDLIFAERPIIVVPAFSPARLNIPANFTEPMAFQAILYEQEQNIEQCFARVEPDQKAAFLALHNSHLHDGSGPLLGRVRTNGFGLDLPSKGEQISSLGLLANVHLRNRVGEWYHVNIQWESQRRFSVQS